MLVFLKFIEVFFSWQQSFLACVNTTLNYTAVQLYWYTEVEQHMQYNNTFHVLALIKHLNF